MVPLVDGDIALAAVVGTELEHFSAKGPRYVVLAYHDDVHAFVYPLTGSAPKGGKGIRHGGSWVVTDRGLFRLPIGALTATGERLERFPALREGIRRHLREREERALHTPDRQLRQNPFGGLQQLRKPDPPKPNKAMPKPKPKTNSQTWEEYLRHDLDEDIKRRGREGRS